MKRFVISVLSAAFGVLFITVAASEAGEVKGTVKKIDAGKSTVTVTVDGEDKTFTVNKDASFTSVSIVKGKKPGKEMEKVEAIDALSGIKEGAKVTLLTETVDEKEVVKAVKVDGGTTMAKKKKKDK